MLYLLDTNAWLRWLHRPEELSQTCRRILGTQSLVGLSPMSIVEVAQKSPEGSLELPLPLDVWVAESLPKGRVKLLPISPSIALSAYRWPDDFHGDPADRIIAATAHAHHLILVTSDKKLLDRDDVPTLSTR